MRLFSERLTIDVGPMSAAGILVVLYMGPFYLRHFRKHMHDDEARARRTKP